MPVHGTHNAVEDDRNEKILIYVNGELFPRNEAKISVFDSGYLVGDGIWEALRLHDGVLVFLDEHLNRLWQAAATVGMDLKMTREELTDKLWQTLKANDMHDGVHVRFMVTRGTKKTPSQDPRLVMTGPNLVIIPEYKQASPDSRNRGVTLFTSTIRRGSPDYLDPRLNCHSKLHEVMALVQAIEAGADDVIDHGDTIEIYGAVESFKTIADALHKANVQPAESGLSFVPKQEIELSVEETLQVMKLIEGLEDLDDVQDVYHNVKMSDEVLAALENA